MICLDSPDLAAIAKDGSAQSDEQGALQTGICDLQLHASPKGLFALLLVGGMSKM